MISTYAQSCWMYLVWIEPGIPSVRVQGLDVSCDLNLRAQAFGFCSKGARRHAMEARRNAMEVAAALANMRSALGLGAAAPPTKAGTLSSASYTSSQQRRDQ